MAFGLYFCMYAFRKPFTVGAYETVLAFGLTLKFYLILGQVLGYAIAKFFGIRLISGLNPGNRPVYIIIAMIIAGLSLLFFSFANPIWKVFWMFINGLPLGIIWGLVFSYLEGRRTTEIMAAILSASFIVATGVVKTVGLVLIQTYSVNENWMPALTASLFLIPLLLFTYFLNKTPKPTIEDESNRRKREPMNHEERKILWRAIAPGMIGLILIYMMLTAYRDFRDNYSIEVWSEMGITSDPSVFTKSELPIGILILILFALLSYVKENRRAIQFLLLAILIGLGLIVLSNFMFIQLHWLSPMQWTVIGGIGLYIAYFPFNSMLYDRLIALVPEKGNAGFLIYISDAFGYLGSILILLLKNFLGNKIAYQPFMLIFGMVAGGAGILISIYVYFYFIRKPELKSDH